MSDQLQAFHGKQVSIVRKIISVLLITELIYYEQKIIQFALRADKQKGVP